MSSIKTESAKSNSSTRHQKEWTQPVLERLDIKKTRGGIRPDRKENGAKYINGAGSIG
jgi:hypothetical protein